MTGDPLTALFLGEEHTGLAPYMLKPGPARDVTDRMARILSEVNGFARYDVRAYATALHALALDLCHVTGAPTNGRNHPAHRQLVNQINTTWETR